jgi:hypothetical protein
LSKKHGKVATISTVVSTASVLYNLGNTAKNKYEEMHLYRASVNATSYVYEPMMIWLNDAIKPKRVVLRSTYNGIRTLFDASGHTSFKLDGHRIRVEIEKPESRKSMLKDESVEAVLADNIVFTARSRAGIDALYRKLEELTEQKKTSVKTVYLYNVTTYGWDSTVLPYRDINSIFLPEGAKEDLMADLEKFLGHKDYYTKAGIPWHRGYLFFGKPGNGKTSLVAALAHHYKMDVYNLPLSTVKDDQHLGRLISEMENNSILLFEDVDIFSNSMGRKQEDGGPTLAGLLNALDGVATPSGMLTFMLTNHPEVLEEALVRPGRMDKKLELLPPADSQIESMFAHVYGEPLGVEPQPFDSMASLANVIKANPFDAEAARMEIKA